ncbi:MAG: methionyl-tRNA formyltransferase [Desulfobacterales bacterium]
MSRSFNIVFMGTPDFSVPCLETLHRSRHRVIQVVTQPDRPQGRGRRVYPPPVKTAALTLGLPVIQPEKIKTAAFIDTLARLHPDLMVVVAYGRILPPALLAIPAGGCVNVHASLLPLYRGAAPIHWAIINGETETGITTMLMDAGMDTGDILLTATEPIAPEDTAASLHDRLAVLGARVLDDTLEQLADGRLTPRPQLHARATLAPILKKEDGRIDWHRPAERIYDRIRGLTPWPGAFTFYDGKRLKIYKATALPSSGPPAAPGTIVPGFPDELRVATGKGVICLLEVQGESGNRQTAEEYLRGHSIPAGTMFDLTK